MAFGVKRKELEAFKNKAASGQIALLTHYWLDERFPNSKTVTKVASGDLNVLKDWGRKYQIPEQYIDFEHDGLPHYDLFGDTQLFILQQEGQWEQIERFSLGGNDSDKIRER